MSITAHLVCYPTRFSQDLRIGDAWQKFWGFVFVPHLLNNSVLNNSVLKNLAAAEASKLAMELVAELMVVELMASDVAAHLLPKLGIARLAELANLLKGCRLLIHCVTD